MRRILAAALSVLAIAVLAGCGGGGTTTVLRTITEPVPSGGPGAKKQTVDQKSAGEEAEGATEPSRTLHLRTFRSPSGNIGCQIYEGEVRCDIRKRSWKPPPRPASCSNQVDYGQGLTLSRRGQAGFVCAGDTALDTGAASLAYGTASEVEGLECLSREEGMSCLNRAGHGFFVSVKSYQVF